MDQRRRWVVWIAVAGFGLVLIADGLISAAMTRSVAIRPMTLERAGDPDASIPVWKPLAMDATQPAGTARMGMGEGTTFGIRMTYTLPDGTGVSCHHTPLHTRCTDGWTADFPARPR